jgi:hypothetical protein
MNKILDRKTWNIAVVAAAVALVLPSLIEAAVAATPLVA